MDPVKEADICEFPAWALGPQARTLDIVWQQTLLRRRAAYTLILVDYPVSGSGTETQRGRARVFVAQDMLEAFKSMLSNSTTNGIETRKFTVTRDFVYGQENAEGKDRFLVLHDKARNPYQHRFVPSQYLEFGEGSLKKLEAAGFGSETLDLVAEFAKAFLGDELKDFSGEPRPPSYLQSFFQTVWGYFF